MTINVANVVASIGTDLTNFKLGMKYAETGLSQIEARSARTTSRLTSMTNSVARYDAAADKAARLRATASVSGTSYSRNASDLGRQRSSLESDLSSKSTQLSQITRRQTAAKAELDTVNLAFESALKKQEEARSKFQKVTSSYNTRGGAYAASTIKTATAKYEQATKEYDKVATRLQEAQKRLNRYSDLRGKSESTINSAQTQVDKLRQQEADQRSKHSAYLANLSDRERGLRDRSKDIASHISPIEEEAKASEEAARSRAALAAQRAKEARNSALDTTGNVMIGTGAAIVGVLGAATKVGADYNQQMLTAQHNTVMTADGMETMRKTVEKLGLESGADLKGLTDSFRLIQDFGFDAAKSTQLLTIAMHAAVATGADLTVTSELLGKAVKEFGIPVDKAGSAMNVMVAAGNRSRLTMDQMVHVGGQLYATAANLGLSFVETNAVLVDFTKHGLSGSEAAVQLKNDINKIIAPSKTVRDILAQLDKNIGSKIGVNLTKDFSPAGLRARGYSGILEDVRKVSDTKDKFPADLGVKLFPNLRGTVGAVIGLGTGFKDLHDDIKALNAAAVGGDAVMTKYGESMSQTNQQIERAKNAMTLASAEVEKALSPVVVSCASVVANLARSFTGLSTEAKNNAVIAAALGGSFLIVTGVALKAASAITAMDAALVALGTGGLRAVITGFGAWAGAMALPLALLTAVVVEAGFVAKRMYDASHEQEIFTQAAKETAAQNSATAQTGYNHARSIASLVIQYKSMQAQAIATHKPVGGMQQILDQISVLSPSLVSGFDAQGHAIALMGNAAEITTQKLAGMAAMTRAAMMNEEKLNQARTGEELNVHKRALIAAQNDMRNSDHAGIGLSDAQRSMRQRLGMPIPVNTAAQQRALSEANARARAEEQQIREITARFKQQGAHADSYNAIPKTADEAKHRETERLYEDYDILKDRLRQATNAYVEFHRAQKGKDDGTVHKNLADAKAQLKLTADELELRRKSLLTPPKTTPGENPWAGLGVKQKKEKKPSSKKTDEQRQEEEYLRAMESIKQSEFIDKHQGEDGERAKEAQALWETEKHGAVLYNGVLKEINGSFYDLGTKEKQAYILAARGQDFLAQQRKQAEAYKDYRNDAILNSMQNDPDANGEVATPKETEKFKLDSGYYKKYGDRAPQVSSMNAATGEEALRKQKEDLLKKWDEEVAKYGGKEISVHDQVLAAIKSDVAGYRLMGSAAAEAYATAAQHTADFTKSSEQFSKLLGDNRERLKQLQEEGAGPKSEAIRMSIVLQNKEYANMSMLGRAMLLITAQQIDKQKQLNDKTKESADAHLEMSTNVAEASANLTNVGDPKAEEYYSYKTKIMAKYTETLKTASDADRAALEAEIQANFDEVSAMEDQTKRAQALFDINKQVSDSIKELTQTYKVNTDGLKITTTQWDNMTFAQQANVVQMQKLTQISDLGKQAVSGLGDMFSHELNNIRDHGFKNFFKDILNMFNTMLFNMAEQWAQAQITKSLTGLVGGLIGGGGGGGIGGVVSDAGDIGADSAGSADLLSGIGQAATGGSIPSDAPTLVGERGPELFMPGRAGTIIPNNALGNGGGGGTTTVHMHISGVTDLPSWQSSATQNQVMQTLTRSIQKVNSGGRS